MRRPDYDRRVVVTGLGVISPVGNDKTTAQAKLPFGFHHESDLFRRIEPYINRKAAVATPEGGHPIGAIADHRHTVSLQILQR